MSKHSKKPQKRQEEKQTSNQDVIIHIVDTFYNLINSGNFIGVILLFIILLSFLVVWKLPPELLSNHIGTILKILESDKYYLIVLAPTTAISIAANFVQRKIYKTEIRRLVYLRKLLMHGRREDILKSLEDHHPSEFDLDNGE